jgi:hypothetical protein
MNWIQRFIPPLSKPYMLLMYWTLFIHALYFRDEHAVYKYIFTESSEWIFTVWFVIGLIAAFILNFVTIKNQFLKTFSKYLLLYGIIFCDVLFAHATFSYIDNEIVIINPGHIVLMGYLLLQILVFVIMIKRPPTYVKTILTEHNLKRNFMILISVPILTLLISQSPFEFSPIWLSLTFFAIGAPLFHHKKTRKN